MKRTNIPPKNTKNKMYENQNEKLYNPTLNEISTVWIKRVNPIASGWESCVNKNDKISRNGAANMKILKM